MRKHPQLPRARIRFHIVLSRGNQVVKKLRNRTLPLPTLTKGQKKRPGAALPTVRTFIAPPPAVRKPRAIAEFLSNPNPMRAGIRKGFRSSLRRPTIPLALALRVYTSSSPPSSHASAFVGFRAPKGGMLSPLTFGSWLTWVTRTGSPYSFASLIFSRFALLALRTRIVNSITYFPEKDRTIFAVPPDYPNPITPMPSRSRR